VPLSQHAVHEIRALPARFPEIRSAVMPALDIAQEDAGHLTPDAMSEVAGLLKLDPGYVEGVATFYSLFHLQPVGKHRFYVCDNLSCMLRGAQDLIGHLHDTLGVSSPDEVSRDGLFSVEAVECLGACEYAPMMRLDHQYHYDLTAEKLDQLIDERRAAFPSADLLIHPECGCSSQCVWAAGSGAINSAGTFVLSTEGMLKHAHQTPKSTFLIATEVGLLHRLRKEMPTKTFLAADNEASCRYMKMINLDNLRDCLRDVSPVVDVPVDIEPGCGSGCERGLQDDVGGWRCDVGDDQ
jgi:NADH-quinone oxidoreductase subunit E